MRNKTQRLLTIKRIIAEYKISSQEELLDNLKEHGFKYTQATLSRDLKFLRVVKVFDEHSGYIYVLPESRKNVLDAGRISEAPVTGFVSLEFSNNFAVIKTLPGYASSIAYAIDSLSSFEILGTIAGDDTILIIPRDSAARADIRNVLSMVIPDLAGRD
ncbi:arginine repressor [Bacteroidota bacterium]